jgi:hypothetical protein
MKKRFLKIAIASMVLGAGGGAIYKQATEFNTASASGTTVQEGESFEIIETSNDKTLYKEFDSKIKLPKKVQLDSGETLEKENKADSFVEADVREYVRVKEYIHQYYDDKKNENVTFQVFNEEIDLDLGEDKKLGLVTAKDVTLKNGIKATFANGEDRDLLHFYDEASDLTYVIVGTKKNGEFKEKDLLNIANSMY